VLTRASGTAEAYAVAKLQCLGKLPEHIRGDPVLETVHNRVDRSGRFFPGLIRARLLDGLDESLHLVHHYAALAQKVPRREANLELQVIAVFVMGYALKDSQQAAPHETAGTEPPHLATVCARSDKHCTRAVALHSHSPLIQGDQGNPSILPHRGIRNPSVMPFYLEPEDPVLIGDGIDAALAAGDPQLLLHRVHSLQIGEE
jgi:hypothetical protein